MRPISVNPRLPVEQTRHKEQRLTCVLQIPSPNAVPRSLFLSVMMVMSTLLLLLAEHVVEHAFELCGDRLREQEQA